MTTNTSFRETWKLWRVMLYVGYFILWPQKMYNLVNQISLLPLLDKLWVKYKDLWNGTIWLIEDGKLTNGWRVNIRDNYIHDFSWKWRASGPPFSFVQKYLNLTNQETFWWFKEHFNIENSKVVYRNRWSPKQKKNMSTSSYSRNRLNDL